VDSQLLNQSDIDYLNAYQSKVYKLLSPLLNDEEKEFLREKTQKIT
jgi:Xaa-Pro aminopeptidase